MGLAPERVEHFSRFHQLEVRQQLDRIEFMLINGAGERVVERVRPGRYFLEESFDNGVEYQCCWHQLGEATASNSTVLHRVCRPVRLGCPYTVTRILSRRSVTTTYSQDTSAGLTCTVKHGRTT